MPPKGRDIQRLPYYMEKVLRDRAIDAEARENAVRAEFVEVGAALLEAQVARFRAEQRTQVLSRRLDIFMAGPWWKRVWVALWRGKVPGWWFERKGEA